jgi:hypothetical protein
MNNPLEILEIVESTPVSPDDWPTVGSVSRDRSSVIGLDEEIFLFQGSNNHYDAYFDETSVEIANKWADLISQRHRKIISENVNVISLIIPNKATCVPSCFPMPLPNGGTVIWQRLKSLLRDDYGVLFPLQYLKNSQKASLNAWSRTDSHWSKSGCLVVLNELLNRMGLPSVAIYADTNSYAFSGDLSSKWKNLSLVEVRRDLCSSEIESINPVLQSDNGHLLSAHFGRKVNWQNINALYQIDLTVVGNSFCGPGLNPRELTWWLARIFRSVTFLHMSEIPIDLTDVFDTDYVIFQTVERFLYLLPSDVLTLAQLSEIAEVKNC